MDGYCRFCEDMLLSFVEVMFSGFCVVLWRTESVIYLEKRYFAKYIDAQCFMNILCGKKPLSDLLVLILSTSVSPVQ